MFDPYDPRTPLFRCILSLLALLLITGMLETTLKLRSRASVLKADSCERTDFRQQHITSGLYRRIWKMAADKETGTDSFIDILKATMLNSDFYPEQVLPDATPYQKYKPAEYEQLKGAYQSVWSDLKYFPIPSTEIYFENSYGAPRDYGGPRTHEGCDLFGTEKEPGYYPVLSITDGVVENIGWLPLGGYRIGIRAPKGGYFYYAHLDAYEKEFRTGEEISAGDILGYMGNTGYGGEGTQGMFPVHLHLGIYIRTPHYEELSVNPYWVLKAISKKIRNYSY